MTPGDFGTFDFEIGDLNPGDSTRDPRVPGDMTKYL